MLQPGWIDAVFRTVLLVWCASALTACGSLSSAAGAPSGANPVSQAPSSPELQARYDALVNRLRAGDATAMADMETFSTAHPELGGPLLNLGLARARSGDEAAARTLFERASTVCSRCGSVWSELGVLDRQQGRFVEAEKAYRRAIELEPEYAAAYYNLAVLYELYIPRPDLALENYERYLQIAGSDARGRDVEKWVADLRRRVHSTPKSARAEGTS
jgi:tetratricopeptide (TPR) repeat protein